jgi:hypothetical protein
MKTRLQHFDRANRANRANAAQPLAAAGFTGSRPGVAACESCEPQSRDTELLIPNHLPADRNPGRPLPLENTVNDVTTEFLQRPPENAAMQRVQQWFAQGRRLAWLPIFSQANFPEVPVDILEWADRGLFQSAWPISRVEDLARLPAGITGWLLPEGEDDTDMVVRYWDGAVHFLGAKDRRTGEQQTLMLSRKREIECHYGDPGNVVGDYPG